MPAVCPSCKSPVETEQTVGEIVCTACGSSFRLGGATATASWTPERQKLGKFELLELVGSGTFGGVYRARNVELGRTVAVKVPRAFDLPSADDAQRFLREARCVGQLRHPTIVPVFEIGQESGRPFLVSEFIQGITLADLVTSERLTPRAAAELVAELADALHYAHEQGIVHRDVKPSNVMLEQREAKSGERRYVPKLMDFGLAKRDGGEATMTVEGQVLGTPAYMSPEQARGDSHAVDGRSDVYSLGAILYQLLTGVLPFQGNARMLLHQVLNDEPTPLRQCDGTIPRDLETVCLKAMAKEPGRRYQTAADLAADLRRYLADQPIQARRSGRIEKTWRWARRNKVTAGLSTSVLVLLVCVVVVLSIRKPIYVTTQRTEPTTSSKTAEDELLQVVAELDHTDPDWRLEQIEAKRKEVPDAENGALTVGNVRKLLTTKWFDDQISALKVALEALPPTQSLSAEEATAVRAALERAGQAAVDEARKLARQPEGRYPLRWKLNPPTRDFGPDGTVPNFSNPVQILLILDAERRIFDGDLDGALLNGRAILNAGRSIGDDPFVPFQLIRLSRMQRAMVAAERVAAQGVCSAEACNAYQRLLDDEENYNSLLVMARGDRAGYHWLMTAAQTGDVKASELTGYFVGKVEGVERRWPVGAMARPVHAWLLRHMTKLAELSRLPSQEVMSAARVWHEEGEREGPAPVVGDQALSSYPRLVEFSVRRRAYLRTAITAIAAERFRQDHDCWPGSLAELSSKYLREVPVDPYNGAPLRYRKTNDGVVVYSVGPNEADDQGTLDQFLGFYQADAKTLLPYDVGFQLWDVSARGKGK